LNLDLTDLSLLTVCMFMFSKALNGRVKVAHAAVNLVAGDTGTNVVVLDHGPMEECVEAACHVAGGIGINVEQKAKVSFNHRHIIC